MADPTGDSSATAVESRVVVLPTTSADATAIEHLLRAHRIGCRIVRDLDMLCQLLREGAIAAIVSEEALSGNAVPLVNCISEQPVWSDIPLLVLSRSGPESPALTRLVPMLGNVSVIERPVRMTTLVSLVRSSIRARERQYQVRAHLLAQQRAETAIREAEQTERHARTEAERAGRIKDEFLATLSHELRTPLHAVLGWSQVLRRSPELDSKVAAGLSVIERNARSQAQIISDLLDMSSIVSGKVRLDIQRIDLAGVIEAAVNTVKPAADAKEIRLQVRLDPLAPPVRGDPNRLQQVFWNLLANAVKFTPRNGQVSVTLERASSHLETNISDSGEGIDPSFLPYVFDRFRQADASVTRQHGGLGLGLSIVKQLVELHGGTVSVKSPGKNEGSTFRVALPMIASQEDPSRVTGARPQSAAGATAPTAAALGECDLNGLTVLVVDDEPDARALIRDLLEGCGATVVAASDAEEALALLAELTPDVVLSDIGMPGEDGYALIRRIRALSDERGRTPAIALTAYARVEDRIKAISSGYQMHLSKPVEPLELIAMVASWKK